MELRTHCIVEIEKHIFGDCVRFARAHCNVTPIWDDFYCLPPTGHYDCVFCDPYDYGIAESGTASHQEGLFSDYCRKMAAASTQHLRLGGVLCFPSFGDGELPLLDGYRRVVSGEWQDQTGLRLWDGTLCLRGQLGYYERLASVDDDGRECQA